MTAAARALATSPSRAASARRRVLVETAAYWALEGIRWLAAWLPEGLLETAAAVIGDIAFFVIRWRRRVAWARVARAWPQLSHAQQRRLVRNSYAHLARALLWTLRLPRVVHRDGANAVARLVEIDAATRAQLTRLIPAIDDRESRPRSAIVVTGHIGVWELLPALLASSSLVPRHTQWIVYRPLHNASVNAIVEELRGGEDRQLIADKHCFHTLAEALVIQELQPSIVGLVADQRSSNPHTRCTVQFLGQETLLSTGAASLHVATRSPLWFAALVVNENSNTSPRKKPFKLLLHPISSCDDEYGANDQKVQALTQAYAQALEETVRAHPSQYLWIHDLWSTQARQLVSE